MEAKRERGWEIKGLRFLVTMATTEISEKSYGQLASGGAGEYIQR